MTRSLVRLTWHFSSCKPSLVTATHCSTLPLLCTGTSPTPLLFAVLSTVIRRRCWRRLDRLSLDYAPLFVTPAQLDDFDRLLTPEGMRAQIHKTLLQLSAIGTELQDQWLVTDPLQLRRFAFARLSALRGTFRFDPTLPYFLSPDGTALLIKIAGWHSVHDMAGAKATVAVIQQASDALRAQPAFRELTVQATGGYFFAAESERVIRRDIIVSVHLTLVSICALLVWALRRWGVLLYGFLPTVLGLVLALGIFAVLRSTLNALTLGCIASLIGFGMDYAVHILQRAFNEHGRGHSWTATLRIAIAETGGGLWLAALTTIACFVAFGAARQRFLHDLGWLAAVGMGLSCFLSVTFLPSAAGLAAAAPAAPPAAGAGTADHDRGCLPLPAPHPRPVPDAVVGGSCRAVRLATQF